MNFIFDNDRPIYIQLVEQLKICIVNGFFKPGDRLPSVRDAAVQTQVNPNTMQKALTELENEGLINTERTNGKFVTKNIKLINNLKQELAKEKINKYLNDMNKIGFSNDEAITCLKEFGGK